MKKISMILVAATLFIACNNESKPEASQSEEKKPAENIAYAYKPEYSSDFSIGNANHSKMVLDLYKMWEEGRIDDMKSLLADSVTVEGTDGWKFDNTADSLISLGKQMRATMSSIKTYIDAWVPIHSNDKNEDYVLIWSRDYTTDKSGKMDSTRQHAYWEIKNNKIRSWSEFQQKMAASPAKK